MAKGDPGYRRVDIFSLKGGVGKTTLAVLLAESLTRPENGEGKTVLVIDADLTGTCLGDLLQHWVSWPECANLAHLVCGRPERLGELLAPGSLPVYVYDRNTQSDAPTRVETLAPEPRILFCPSLAETTADGLPDVQRPLLQAMLSHENAGGFVSLVIERVIEEVKKIEPGLAAVIVDHGPGLSSLQWASLKQCGSPHRRALFVTSRDAVDLRAVHALEVGLDKPLREQICWVVNRVPADGHQDWQERISSDHHRGQDWYKLRASPLYRDEEMASAYAEAGYLHPDSINQPALSAIRRRLFD